MEVIQRIDCREEDHGDGWRTPSPTPSSISDYPTAISNFLQSVSISEQKKRYAVANALTPRHVKGSRHNFPSHTEKQKVIETKSKEGVPSTPATHSEQRQSLYMMFRTPILLEPTVIFGILICIESFMFWFTLFPIRVLVSTFKLLVGKHGQAAVHDIARATVCFVSLLILDQFVSIPYLYHLIRKQSFVKLYGFYSMLEYGDRMLSSIGVDVSSALLSTASELVDDPKRPQETSDVKRYARVSIDIVVNVVHVCLHSLLILCQFCILGSTLNSRSHNLISLLVSVKFTEIKSTIFKSFDDRGLFQITLSDIGNRFVFCLLLVLVALHSVEHEDWSPSVGISLSGATSTSTSVPTMLALVLLVETIVDWVKHGIVIKNNGHQPRLLYPAYQAILAQDSQHKDFDWRDPTTMTSRRIGISQISLFVTMCILCGPLRRVLEPMGYKVWIGAFVGLHVSRGVLALVIKVWARWILSRHDDLSRYDRYTFIWRHRLCGKRIPF
eukprot:gnl/Dysnectes_brevis/3236_a4049_766.p1 GENE.gnl/Dysnectes_brevis/3236_a4049_766~~gnl/Dysnectes_brevis/3236_a4049_766.p1  ORF type:complete len:499 (+),score=61.18 gnl/Dysnectes_brevis/3236_a4049_766:120-1616(+)